MQSDAGPTFFVGHHDTERSEPASTLLIQQAQNAGVRLLHVTYEVVLIGTV